MNYNSPLRGLNIVCLLLMMFSVSYADVTWSDSPLFPVDLRYFPSNWVSVGYGDSSVFSVDLRTIRSGWKAVSWGDSGTVGVNLYPVRRASADSASFAYMYAYAEEPPASTVLQITGIGTLHLVDINHSLDVSKPTIIMTHGWNPTREPSGQVPSWIAAMSQSIFSQTWSQEWNVLWWDWLDKAKAFSPVGPARLTQWQGSNLGVALMETLGTYYEQNIHFIGHSLGTAVNRWAVDLVHRNGWSSQRTHVTLLDVAEIGSGELSRLVKPIPDEALYIDNYITAFGNLHEKARNVILTQGVPILPTDILDYIDYHAYSTVWYDRTISNPLYSYMGFTWSFPRGNLGYAPSEGFCYAQTSNPWDDEGNLTSITWSDAKSRLIGRAVMQIGQGASVVLGAVKAPLKMLGDVVIDKTKEVVTAKLKEAVSVVLPLGEGQIIAMDTGPTNTSSYLWIPLTIPPGRDLMTFDYRFTNSSDGDYITVGINEQQVFVMEARFAEDGEYLNSSYIDISGYSGQNVEVIVAFNCDDIPGGELDVTNFQFHSTAVPVDLNKDGLVNYGDVAVIAEHWQDTDCNELNEWCNGCDFDRNGTVDIIDLAVIVNHWLRDAGDPSRW